MATRNIVPRATAEGGLGTTAKRWATAFINAITCTTINAITLAAQAIGFTIAGGTTSKTLTISGDIEIGQGFTTPGFSAGDYTASGAMTWTVGAGDVTTMRYLIIGKLMIVLFYIATSTVGGTPHNQLRITIPAGKLAAVQCGNYLGRLFDNSVLTSGQWIVTAGGSIIIIKRADGGNFSLSTDLMEVEGVCMFEIQ